MNQKARIASKLLPEFKIPIAIVIGIIFFFIFSSFGLLLFATGAIVIAVFLGSYHLLIESFVSITKKQFALDYIAILAIITALLTEQYLVAAILALMVSTGSALEEYGVSQAKKSLTSLIDRIPSDVTLWINNKPEKQENISKIVVGDEIFIRKGEVIALDGKLISEKAETDESSLTGEPYFIEKIKGDTMRSGTINIGSQVVIRVTKAQKDSTYKKIIDMVKKAENEKSPLVRLADRYSTLFTLVTFIIAGFAFVYSQFNLSSVLAVLAVATPCPLIIATPIALLGGVNASAKRKIIIKNLAALEVLSRINALVFDKTGTITFGKPKITAIEIHDKKYEEQHLIEIADAIERNSLHPLAKAIVAYAKEKKTKMLQATHVEENIGKGISGVIQNKTYALQKLEEKKGMAIQLLCNSKTIAVFQFEDEIKQESKGIIQHLLQHNLELQIFTGDKKESAQEVADQLGKGIIVHAEYSPEDKQKGIEQLKKQGKITAMVGDGINDAPALALADVGMAFSNQEQTAASEAADIVFLGGDFSMVLDAWQIAKKTISIAKQSILWGIGLSVIAMLFASVGFIPPLVGAGLQEAIDVAVILNALRASR